jgi:TRAP-type C4-dicarboxylate transport system permease large subunit
MLMGQIAYHSGIAQRLYDSMYKLIGRIPGGLAMATCGSYRLQACAVYPCDGGHVSSVAVPQMTRYNYNKKLSTE